MGGVFVVVGGGVGEVGVAGNNAREARIPDHTHNTLTLHICRSIHAPVLCTFRDLSCRHALNDKWVMSKTLRNYAKTHQSRAPGDRRGLDLSEVNKLTVTLC